MWRMTAQVRKGGRGDRKGRERKGEKVVQLSKDSDGG